LIAVKRSGGAAGSFAPELSGPAVGKRGQPHCGLFTGSEPAVKRLQEERAAAGS